MDFLHPLPSRPKCLHSLIPCNFKPPPLDGTLTIPEIFDWHYIHNPDQLVFIYSPSTQSIPGLRQLSYKEVVPAIHRAGYYIADACGFDLASDYKTYSVVALLATADTITTFTTIVGMLRAGIIVFPISPRFSSDVIAHLVGKNNVSHVIVSTEEHIRDLAEDAIEKAKREYSVKAPRICQMPEFQHLYTQSNSGDRSASFLPLPGRAFDMSSTSFIVHSSSSTSHYPKAVRWTSRSNLQNAMAPLFSTESLCSQIFGCHGIELFHTLGLLFIFFTSSSGLTLATFPPQSPAVVATPQAVFQGFIDVKPHYALANPRFIQEWAHDSTKVLFMSTLQGLMYGGKLMSRYIGDTLTNAGVKLLPSYGSTEAGQVSAMVSEYSQSYGWEYFKISPHTSPELVRMGGCTFKLYLMSTPTQDLPCVNALLQGRDAYDTGDLLVSHPMNPGLWKVLGRVDDQVMLSTGEVTHPAQLEDILCQHPLVESVVIFGQARPRIGVIVELKKEHMFNPDNHSLRREFLEDFWPHVDAVNETIPQFTRIAKEMILVSKPSRPFVYTQKRSPKRAVILTEYQQAIDSLYGGPESDPLYSRALGIGTPASKVPRKGQIKNREDSSAFLMVLFILFFMSIAIIWHH